MAVAEVGAARAGEEQTNVRSRFRCCMHLANSTFEPVLLFPSSLFFPFSEFIQKFFTLSSCSSELWWVGLQFPANQTQGPHQCPQSPRRGGLSLLTQLPDSSKGRAPTPAHPEQFGLALENQTLFLFITNF